MKKETIICILVIIIVAIGNLVTQNYTEKCVSIINDDLIELENKMKKEDKDQKDMKDIKEKVAETKETWNQMQEKLAFYIEHDELEKVETQLFLLKGQADTRLYSNAVAEIEKCIFILEHIEDKNALNIKNIF